MIKTHPIIKIVQYLLMFLYISILLIPVLWIIYCSFRYESALFTTEIFSNPQGLTFSHYQKLFFTSDTANFLIYTTNSLKVAILTVSFVVIIGLSGAYILSRYRLKYQNGIILLFLSSQMFPGILMTISIFSFFYKLNLTNSLWGLSLGHLVGGLPFALWMMKGYIDAIPKELDEAARIDGLGVVGILNYIIFPLAAPGLAVACFYAFMGSWGDYLFASVIIESQQNQTLPLGLARFFSSQQVQWGAINAAVVISLLPTVLLFLLLQKSIVEGLTSGGIKH
ncbi:MAG: carbohydrate ABC transporter permease [Brevinema sp.]